MTTEPESRRIILAEFLDGRVFGLVVDTGSRHVTYDVEYCKRDDQLYYERSGCGPRRETVPVSLDYWIAPDAGIEVEVSHRIRKEADGGEIRVLPVRLTEPLQPFDPKTFFEDDQAWEEPCIYCTACDDWMPRDTDRPCEHLWWCNECADFSGKGAEDPCDHTSEEL